MVEPQTQQTQTLSFILRPITPSHKPITIHYQFQHSTKATEVSNLRTSATLPIFNCDRLFFTPTFILNLDYNYYRVNQIYQGQKFQQRIKEVRQQASKKELYLPQPSQNFCQICRSEFENYHQHLISRFHLNFMRKSKGNKWIGEACRSLLKGSRQKKKKNSERPLYSEQHQTPTIKKKGKSKTVNEKKNHFSRDFSDEQIRLPLSTQVSFERE